MEFRRRQTYSPETCRIYFTCQYERNEIFYALFVYFLYQKNEGCTLRNSYVYSGMHNIMFQNSKCIKVHHIYLELALVNNLCRYVLERSNTEKVKWHFKKLRFKIARYLLNFQWQIFHTYLDNVLIYNKYDRWGLQSGIYWIIGSKFELSNRKCVISRVL